MKEISVSELRSSLTGPNPPVLLDIREEWEWALAHVEGARLIPMGRVPEHLAELPRDRDIVVMCHRGGRSRQIVLFLRQNGYERVINLRGGIDAWSHEVDPGVPCY